MNLGMNLKNGTLVLAIAILWSFSGAFGGEKKNLQEQIDLLCACQCKHRRHKERECRADCAKEIKKDIEREAIVTFANAHRYCTFKHGYPSREYLPCMTSRYKEFCDGTLAAQDTLHKHEEKRSHCSLPSCSVVMEFQESPVKLSCSKPCSAKHMTFLAHTLKEKMDAIKGAWCFDCGDPWDAPGTGPTLPSFIGREKMSPSLLSIAQELRACFVCKFGEQKQSGASKTSKNKDGVQKDTTTSSSFSLSFLSPGDDSIFAITPAGTTKANCLSHEIAIARAAEEVLQEMQLALAMLSAPTPSASATQEFVVSSGTATSKLSGNPVTCAWGDVRTAGGNFGSSWVGSHAHASRGGGFGQVGSWYGARDHGGHWSGGHGNHGGGHGGGHDGGGSGGSSGGDGCCIS